MTWRSRRNDFAKESDLNIETLMSTGVVTANLRDGLRQTLVRMHERDIRHMPVLDDAGCLAGIISERDLRRPDWVDEGDNLARPFVLDNDTKIQAAMTGDPITVTVEDTLAHALDLFIEHGFGAMPVVDRGRKLVGMLSTVDLLRGYRQLLEG